MADAPHVIVVGAGIIGAGVAYHLARDGARVTLMDAEGPGGIATAHSWAWINASWGNPEPYFRLRQHAMAEWRRLAAELPQIKVDWAGGLLYDAPRAELDAYLAQHNAWGYDIRRIDRAEVARLEPALASPPDVAVHVRSEGAVDPVATARILVDAAIRAGATLVQQRVQAIDVAAGRAIGIVSDAGRLAADHIVIAAGVATAALAATANIVVPMEASPGLLVATQPTSKTLNGLVMAPEMHVRQLADGRLLAGADFGGSDPGIDAAATAQSVFAGLKSMLKTGRDLVFDRYLIGHRPLPADGFPIVGRSARDGLYIAITHSGITLAPALGAFVASELLGRGRAPLLAPYGLDRFS